MCVCVHLQVRHLGVALFGARVVRQLDVPEAGQLVNQDGVLLDEGVEDVLRTVNTTQRWPETAAHTLLLHTATG